MNSYEYQEFYKGIFYIIKRSRNEYIGFIIDSEGSFTTSSKSLYEVKDCITNYIDSLSKI
jgi:hypothetical protein